ncbi:MAG: L,D-transpeptidase family protein [Acidimicrobiia bacterium]
MRPPSRHSLHRRDERGATAVIIAIVVVLLLGAGVGVFALTRGGDDPSGATPVPSAAPVRVAAPNVSADLGAATFRSAWANGKDIPVYAAPDATAAPVQTLSQRTDYDVLRTLLVFNSTGDWLQVYLPTRPNNSTGWVKTSDVGVSATPIEWAVKVDLAAYKVTVLHNGAVDFVADAAIGSDQYPTPTGTFYITDPIDLRQRPGTGYGAYALGLSGHSDVLTEFGGGDGQIALHGTDNPSDVGKAISHGCVRLKNDDIVRLSTLPLGTPVIIS